jgi:hypothetical protein
MEFGADHSFYMGLAGLKSKMSEKEIIGLDLLL